MADISSRELLELIGEPPPAQAGPTPVSPVRPQRNAADATRIRMQRFTPAGDPVEFDQESGIPFLTRLNVSRAPDQETKRIMLQSAFEDSKVEAAPLYEGGPPQFVIRDYKDPETGRVKDLLVDETAITAKDLADLGQTGIEILGAFMAMRGGAPLTGQIAPGMGRSLTDAALAASGGQLAGALSDIEARGRTAQDLKILPTLQQRNINAAVEGVLGAGTVAIPIGVKTGVQRLWRGVPTTAEAAEGVAARNRLAASTGKNVNLSLGQQTGREGILRSEAFLENVSFGGGPQRAFRNAQEREIVELQNEVAALSGMAGGAQRASTVLPSTDVVGQQAVDALRKVTEGAAGASTAARAGAMDEALLMLGSALSSSTGQASRRVLTGEAGQAARTFMGLKKEAFDEIAGELNQRVTQEAGTDVLIPSKLIQAPVKALREKLSKPQSEELYRFVPANVRAFLEDISNLPDEVGLKDIRNLRTAVNDAVNESEILGSAATGNLKQISKGLTEALDNSVAYISQVKGNPKASQALADFNKFYRENIEGFQVKGITDILADPTQRKLGAFAIFDQATKDPDQYFRLKEALTKPLVREGQAVGPTSTGDLTWSTFKQAMLQEMLDESRMAGNRTLLSAKKFFDKLGGLKAEVQSDLLGQGEGLAKRALTRLEGLQDPKIDSEELLEALRRGGDTALDQIELLARQDQRVSDLYRNQVIKRFTKGEIGSEAIQPANFIDRYVDTAPANELREVVNLIGSQDAQLLSDIRQKTVQNLFQKARQSPLDDIASARKLSKEINTPEAQERLIAVLGPSGLDRVNDTLKLLTAVQTKTEAASRAMGGMAGGANRSRALLLDLSVIPKQVAYWFMGTVLSNPRLHRIATSPIQPADHTKAVQRLLLETDFLRALVSEYGSEAKTALGMLTQAGGGGTSNGDISAQELERQLNAR